MTSHETALDAARKAVKARALYDPVADVSTLADAAISAYLSTISPDVSGLVERLRKGIEYAACGYTDFRRTNEANVTMSEAADALASLSLQLAAVEGERDDFQRLFDQQWKRTREAGELWRKAHPGNDLVSPDLGELVKWLIERAETAEASLSAAMSNQRDQFDALCAMRNDLNELFPIPSLDSDLQNGPETSVFCAVVVKAVRDALSAAQEENERLRKAVAGCDWYWPEDDTSSDACSNSPSEIAENCDVKPGDVFGYSRGGVIETRYYAYLPPADDADSDDEFEVDEASEELATAKIAAELERRATLSTPSKEDKTDAE